MVTPKFLTIGDAAQYLGVSKSSLRQWERDGKLMSVRTPGGHRRYSIIDLENFHVKTGNTRE